MKLSILICSLESRVEQFNKLFIDLDRQRDNRNTTLEILVERDNGEQRTGSKRNRLLERAQGEYICFIDDDDEISTNYINILLEAIKTNPDCVSLRGVITTSGRRPFIFEHSIRYKVYKTNEDVVTDLDMDGWNMPYKIKYERYPNHLNCIRASIAKQFKFPEINHGEDTDWATQIFKSGLIKTEFYTDEILYYYRYNPIK